MHIPSSQILLSPDLFRPTADPAFAESVSLYRHIRPSRRDAPFPRRVQYLIPAIRSGFFRVHPESLVQERLSPFIMTIWQTKTLAGQSVMNG